MPPSTSTPPVDYARSDASNARTILGHPPGLFVLFSTELWERFSFYSMRAFLVLYMTQALAMSKQISSEIYGAYLGFVYAAPFVGGVLADRLLGQRRAIVIGGFLMAAAQFTLGCHSLILKDGGGGTLVTQAMFFLALGLLSAGNGFFKPNISSIVGSLYQQGDPRRDGAFTIFYMGINIGAFLAGISGQVAERYGWHWGFFLAGTGMLIGQVIFFGGRSLLQGQGLPPSPRPDAPGGTGIKQGALLILGVAVFLPVAAFLISRPSYVQGLAIFVAAPFVGYVLWETFRCEPVDRDRMLVIMVLSFFSVLFWAFFELAGSAINLFTNDHVERVVRIGSWSFEAKASLLTASTNPFLIILLGIPFAKLWVWLAKKQAEPPSPLKFSLGLLQLAAGFVVLYLGAKAAGETGKCSLLFLLLGFFLHTTGELCLSPVGLSTITKLSPAKFVGMFMGVWFLASSLGNILGGWVGGKTEHYGYSTVFMLIAIVTAVAGGLLLLVVSPLKRMMHGVK